MEAFPSWKRKDLKMEISKLEVEQPSMLEMENPKLETFPSWKRKALQDGSFQVGSGNPSSWKRKPLQVESGKPSKLEAKAESPPSWMPSKLEAEKRKAL